MRTPSMRSLIVPGLLAAMASLPILASNTSCEPESSVGLRAAEPNARQSQSIRQWSEQIARQATTTTERTSALLQRAESYRSLGRYYQAEEDYAAALDLAEGSGPSIETAIATLGLGEVALARRHHDKASVLLERAAQQAKHLKQPELIAASANALGNLRQAQGRQPAAADHYRGALTAATRAGDAGLAASAQVNLAALAGSGTPRSRELNGAFALAAALPAGNESARLLLRIGYLARQGGSDSSLALARKSLTMAAAQADTAGLQRERAEALGQSAELAAATGRAGEARGLLLQALQLAPLDAHDLRYQWEWQLARGFETAGDLKRALAAYRRAVGHLEKISGLIPVDYAEGRSSFRETLEPLYLGLSDLLLREAAATKNSGAKQQFLREARDNIEQLKVDELRDYFRDACIAPLRQKIDTLNRRTAVLYPVLFPDRLELILSAGGQMAQETLLVDPARIELAAQILAVKLRYDQPIEPEARELYNWLISPIESRLREDGIDTLIFVPDGALRSVPAAVLLGPSGYLVNEYAVATTLGLQLLQPKSLGQVRPKTLITGVSRPGPVIDELPDWWVSALVRQHRRSLGRGAGAELRGTSVPVQGRGSDGKGANILRAAREETIEALSLPGVAAEIEAISKRIPSEVLHNQDFLLERFVNELAQHPYRIVHIASHGLFQGPPEQNFIVTFDRKLDMRRLAAALKPKELDRTPIELLVLSACQTAEGDDRTPLGLSGIALQSGARSALGSLWPVSDAATQQLMEHFYAHLTQGDLSKARALQRAQQIMINSGVHDNPSDWGAFILVGNWL
ncbi:putative ATPase [Thiorhodovibrio winogradskyi]|uniref:ATPase n=1 Tax=Thiorhodovibrio winogradskyi TaxID=77007 RepID=A0ABZ0SBK7_9GAMM|nr:CHAT domain-containing protein [Thiorhodovibrio winogradskyi]